jgi:hypothetical protein
MRRLDAKFLSGALLAAVLAACFWSYTRPDFLVGVAGLWFLCTGGGL